MPLSTHYANVNASRALDEQARNNALARQAGGMLASGDQTGARNALFNAGQLDAGFKVQQNLQADTDAERKREVEFAGNLATGIAKRIKAGVEPEAAWKEGEQWAASQGYADHLPNLRQRWDTMGPDAFTGWLGGEAAKEIEQFTLAPGSARYDINGRQVASQPFAPQYRAVGEGQSLVEVGGEPPASGPSGGVRSERNANPGNIEDGPFARSQPGYAGTDGRFARFNDPNAGRNAQVALLDTYGKRGLNTVAAIIGRWAPAQENDTQAYVDFVSKRLGVDPNQPLNMADPNVKAALADAIAAQEGGSPRQGGGARVVAQGAPKASARPATAQEKAAYGISGDVPAQMLPSGEIRVVSGTGAGLKRIPPKIQEGYVSNSSAIKQIDEAIAALRANPDAMGLKNMFGDEIMQRADPKGVAVRAQVANIGSLKRHDRSGAAVTAAETPILKPFLPGPTDRADAAITKLEGLKRELVNANGEIEVAYGEDSGYTPIGGGRSPAAPVAPARAKTGGGQLRSDPSAISQAKAAIRAGAPKAAVIKRLRDNGINPAGL
jgi:hypothetical protein